MGNPTPIHLTEPVDYNDAIQKSRDVATQRRNAEAWYKDANQRHAQAEHDYRKARAEAFTRLANEPVTAAHREALVDAEVAPEKLTRDLAAGESKAAKERIDGLDGERAQLRALMDMSARQFGAA